MCSDQVLRDLLAIEDELDAILAEGSGGVIDDARIRSTRARIGEVRAAVKLDHRYWLYDVAEPVAKFLKVILQMGIGVAAVSLIWRMVFLTWHDGEKNNLPSIEATLTVIAAALAIAAAVELAYTLFTPGPDEAVDPLMLGLASALSLQLAKAEGLTPSQGLATLAYAAGLGLLFAIRLGFVDRDNEAPMLAERLRQVHRRFQRLH